MTVDVIFVAHLMKELFLIGCGKAAFTQVLILLSETFVEVRNVYWKTVYKFCVQVESCLILQKTYHTMYYFMKPVTLSEETCCMCTFTVDNI